MGTATSPLQWPQGWERTPEHKRKATLGTQRKAPGWEATIERLEGELRRLGARNVVLSTNQEIRRDGRPYATRRPGADTAAAVWFTLGERQQVMAQDLYVQVVDNIRSLAIAIEGLRQMQRHGGGRMLERAFRGFTALPPPGADGQHENENTPWYQVLGVNRRTDLDTAHAAYRSKARRAHPDQGGNNEAMSRLNRAWDEAKGVLR